MMPVVFRTGTLESVPVTTIRSTGKLTPRSIRPLTQGPCLRPPQRHPQRTQPLCWSHRRSRWHVEVVADGQVSQVMTD